MCKMAYSVRFIAKAGCRLHAEETHCKNTSTKSQDCENIVTFLLQMPKYPLYSPSLPSTLTEN